MSPKSYVDVILEHPWSCYLCNVEGLRRINELVQIRLDWQDKEKELFASSLNIDATYLPITIEQKKMPLVVFSAFDGLAGGNY